MTGRRPVRAISTHNIHIPFSAIYNWHLGQSQIVSCLQEKFLFVGLKKGTQTRRVCLCFSSSAQQENIVQILHFPKMSLTEKLREVMTDIHKTYVLDWEGGRERD